MKRRGFTLIELLVVVAIIVTLLAMLMPAMNRAMEAVEIAQCQSNLHQFGVGVASYAQAHYSATPSCIAFLSDVAADPNHAIALTSWYRPNGQRTGIAPSPQGPGGTLYPFVPSEAIYMCPTFATLAPASTPAGNRPVFGYTMHESMQPGGWHGLEITRIGDADVTMPSRQLLMSEESPFLTATTGYAINNSRISVAPDPNPAVFYDGVATYHRPDDRSFRTGRGNVLFFDAHVELTFQRTANDTKRLAYPTRFAW